MYQFQIVMRLKLTTWTYFTTGAVFLSASQETNCRHENYEELYVYLKIFFILFTLNLFANI